MACTVNGPDELVKQGTLLAVTPSIQKIRGDITWKLGDWQAIPESESILPIAYIPMAYVEKVLSFIPFLNF